MLDWVVSFIVLGVVVLFGSWKAWVFWFGFSFSMSGFVWFFWFVWPAASSQLTAESLVCDEQSWKRKGIRERSTPGVETERDRRTVNTGGGDGTRSGLEIAGGSGI